MVKRLENIGPMALLALILVLALVIPSFVQAQDDDARPFVGIRYEQSDYTRITEVLPDSPAEAAGLEVGDLIMAVAGEDMSEPVDINEMTPLLAEIMKYAPGDVITIYVGREDMQLSFDVTLADAADFVIESEEVMPSETIPMPIMPATVETDRAFLGVSYMTLNPDNIAMMAADEEAPVTLPDVEEGALIIEVLDDTPAAEAGLLPGDVVTAVDGDAVDAERELADRLYAYEPDDTVTLTILRDGESIEVEATLMAHPAHLSISGNTAIEPFGHGMFMAPPDFDHEGFMAEHPEMEDFMHGFMEEFDMEDMGPGLHFRMPGFMMDLPEEALTDPDFDWDAYIEENPEFAESLKMFGEDFEPSDLAEILPHFPWFGEGDPFHHDMDQMHDDNQDA